MEKNKGMFLGTTQVWDLSDIAGKKINPELKELLVKMYQNLNLMAMTVNNKDSGMYLNINEYACGQTYFATDTATGKQRAVHRKVVNIGALPDNTTKPVAHGLAVNSSYIFTRIYGAATDTTANVSLPLPSASVVANDNIELWVNATHVNIKTGKNRTSFSTCYVVLEYLKN